MGSGTDSFTLSSAIDNSISPTTVSQIIGGLGSDAITLNASMKNVLIYTDAEFNNTGGDDVLTIGAGVTIDSYGASILLGAGVDTLVM